MVLPHGYTRITSWIYVVVWISPRNRKFLSQLQVPMNFTHHETHHNTNCTPKNVENVAFTDENDENVDLTSENRDLDA